MKGSSHGVRFGILASWCLVLVGASLACSSSRDAPRLETDRALVRVLDVLASASRSGGLVTTLNDCPLGDASSLLDRFLSGLPEYEQAAVSLGGAASAVYRFPPVDVSVVTCAAVVDAATSNFVRIEARPAIETIESLIDVTFEPNSIEFVDGEGYRGGSFYRYCGQRPEQGIYACVYGWRDTNLDVAVSLSGTQPELLNVAGLDSLRSILPDLIVGAGGTPEA